ncbi:phytoene/squalene synthase family protein [Sphingomonas oligophenolica]|uniref:Phytoene/squalene synthase family protein n=1 Tax=Sphingomonas oligophenolica TaxID=301154 RepID=A0A502CUB9_9SPHN|nr:phytoene/squalene synthase family protein [Sphingomonas oligophenolica]TPG15341.1 phytoene/squalene synthase family protein [Sphingomonas oligophenolica]
MSDPPAPIRAAIVATARESIARGSKSFAAASRLFDRDTRERAWLLYAWCRRCDDIVDGQDHGHAMTPVTDAPARIDEIAAMTDTALRGDIVGDPAFDALRIVAAETRLPHRFAHDLIEGFRLDADDWRPRSEADLYRYCYHVAGAVGCMMAVVMGVDPADEVTLDRACDLGMAFQLANIARDIEEDDRAGRCYLPVDWLVEMDMPPGQHMKPPFRTGLVTLARRLTDRAAEFEASARGGTPKLSFRAAWAVLSAASIYGAIGRSVAARGAQAWDHRVTTSPLQKVGFIAAGARDARRRSSRYGSVTRPASLWTRPKQ